jgi:hypothetical protein
VIIEDVIHASIADKNFEAAFKEMVEAEMKDKDLSYEDAYSNIVCLFKTSVILSNLKDEDVKQVKEVLFKDGLPFSVKKEIHWKTLASYVKHKLAEGGNIPRQISVFKYQETKLK